jgi:hypothetical protein
VKPATKPRHTGNVRGTTTACTFNGSIVGQFLEISQSIAMQNDASRASQRMTRSWRHNRALCQKCILTDSRCWLSISSLAGQSAGISISANPLARHPVMEWRSCACPASKSSWDGAQKTTSTPSLRRAKASTDGSAVSIREVQKSLLQSSKRLIEAKIQSLGVGEHFQVLHDRT